MNKLKILFVILAVAVVVWYSIGGFGIKFHPKYTFQWQKCSADGLSNDGIKSIEQEGKTVVVKGIAHKNCATIGMDGTYKVDGNKISIQTKNYQYATAFCNCGYDVTYKIRNLPEQTYVPDESQIWKEFKLPTIVLPKI